MASSISFFRVLKTFISLIVIIIALNKSSSILSLASAIFLMNIVIFVISFINTVLLLKPRLRLRIMSQFLMDSFIFSLNDFFLNIYGRISTVLLSFFSDLHSVGIFSAALRFTKIANLLPNQMKFALLPTMYRILEERTGETAMGQDGDGARRRDGEKNKEKRVFMILLKYMIIFATPAAVMIYFFSEQIIHLIFGQKYNLAIPLVQLFSVFIYLRFIETPFSLFYIAMNKHANMVYFQGATSFLNVVLNLALIPSYSAYGACYATLISESFFALVLIFAGSKYLIWNTREVFLMLFKPTVAAIIGFTLTIILFGKSNIVFLVFSLTIFYGLFLFLVKTFNKEDKELFFKIFKGQNYMGPPSSGSPFSTTSSADNCSLTR